MDHPHFLNIDTSRPRGCLVSISLILLGVVALVILVNFIVDEGCANGAQHWLPAYPDATVIDESYTFIRMWGIGRTQQVLYTPDDVLSVRAWYRESDQQNGLANNRRGVANLVWQAEAAPEGGTNILLFSECAPLLDLSSLGIGNAG